MTMHLRNDASIAHAVVQLASAFEDAPCRGRVAAGVLSRMPGDGAPRLVRNVAAAMGMETVVLHAPRIEVGDTSIGEISSRIDLALATGRPVLVLLDEAHGAPAGTICAIAASTARLMAEAPCLILAISTSSGERGIAEQLAEGLGVRIDEIVMHRTADENLRLVQRLIRAMP